jgi:protein-S-isoprenylcysteine O-methyltransferase Ste14
MTEPNADNPGVITFPPLLSGGTLVVGLILHWLFPRHPFPPGPARLAGVLLTAVGLLLTAWGASTMRRAGTNINPAEPSLALVTDGPFRWSRNPLYLANVILYIGITLLVNALWPFLLLIPMIVLFEWGVIRREERYLLAKFGEPYRAYCARVRRWL